MKSKILFISVLSIIAFHATAQTEKGKNVIGLTGFYASNEENTLTTSDQRTEIKIGLNYGHFIRKNLVLGITASYNSAKSFTPSDYLVDLGSFYALPHALTESRLKYMATGIYLRHYIDLSKKFKLYNELNTSIGFGRQTNEYVAINRKFNSGRYTSYNAGINSGLAFYPTKKISIDLGINVVNFSKTEANYKGSPSNERSENFTFGLKAFKPMLGVNFHF